MGSQYTRLEQLQFIHKHAQCAHTHTLFNRLTDRHNSMAINYYLYKCKTIYVLSLSDINTRTHSVFRSHSSLHSLTALQCILFQYFQCKSTSKLRTSTDWYRRQCGQVHVGNIYYVKIKSQIVHCINAQAHCVIQYTYLSNLKYLYIQFVFLSVPFSSIFHITYNFLKNFDISNLDSYFHLTYGWTIQ